MAGLSNYQNYSSVAIQVQKPNGALVKLTESASVTIEHQTGANPVFTMQKGFAGMSPGSPTTTVSVDNAVPAADFELDPTAFMGDNLPCKFIVVAAGAVLQFDGIITESNFSAAVNSEAKLSFKAMGTFAKWESLGGI